MSKLITCPFCGEEEMYETKRENELGTIIPQLFCNCCKMTFEIENDSPYLNDDKTYDYLKEKLHNLWNTRKPMQNIVEQLEKEDYQKDGGELFLNHNLEDCIPLRRVYEIIKGENGLHETETM